MSIVTEQFNEYFETLIHGNMDRFGIIFQTGQFNYYYDTGTGKVLRCNDDIYQLLYHLFENKGSLDEKQVGLSKDNLENAITELKNTIEKENIFQAKELSRFHCEQVSGFDETVGKKCKQIILEVTQECNLRCRYCVYGENTENFRAFGHKKMSFEIAKKALDYILTIADHKEMHVSFYGGEPLVCYELIKQATEYFLGRYDGEKTDFSFTSNLTLLTPEMAQYFKSRNFLITCSLDGCRELHDENRVYCNGKGTFDDTIKGLRLLVDTYGENCERININMVVSRPYTAERFERNQKFFENLSWLPNTVKIRTTYAGVDRWDEDTKIRPNMELIKDNVIFEDDMEEWIFSKIDQGIDKESIFANSMLDSGMATIHQRRISDTPMDYYGLNGCCIPGSRRLYVTVDGGFCVCEKIGTSPSIGNVENGIQVDAVKQYYVDEYMERSIFNCKNCWAIHLCRLCYACAYDETGLDMKRKKVLCEMERFSTYRYLQKYHRMLEVHSDLLLPYNEIEYF